MTWLSGLPTCVAGGALLYLVAEAQSRPLALVVSLGGLVWLWFAMRRDYRRSQAGRR